MCLFFLFFPLSFPFPSPISQINEAYKIKNQDLAKELKLPPVKLHCSSGFCFTCNTLTYASHPSLTVLAEDAIQAAIKDYRKKNPGKQVKMAAAE